MKLLHWIVFLILIIISGCSGTKIYIQGIDTDWVKEKQWGKVAAGVVSAIATHEAAHWILAEAKGKNPRLKGTMIMYDGDEEDDWIQRIGWVSNVGIGTMLNLIPATRDSDFTLGWNGATAIGLYTYPMRYGWQEGDFMSTGKTEWGIYSGAATFNLLHTVNNQLEE